MSGQENKRKKKKNYLARVLALGTGTRGKRRLNWEGGRKSRRTFGRVDSQARCCGEGRAVTSKWEVDRPADCIDEPSLSKPNGRGSEEKVATGSTKTRMKGGKNKKRWGV